MEIIAEMEQTAARALRRCGGLYLFQRQHGHGHHHPHRLRYQDGQDDRAQAGAGIVADSDPERERQETVNKARSVQKALALSHMALSKEENLMILMIDNYDSFTYNLVPIFSGRDRVPVGNTQRCITLADAIEALKPAGIVISPGPGGPEDAGISLAAIRHFSGRCRSWACAWATRPLAEAFGGKIIGAQRLMHGKTSTITADGKAFSGHHQTVPGHALPLPGE
jgi:carbamoylphosphate synthase small subunit